MQCLCCLGPLTSYFADDSYLADVDLLGLCGGALTKKLNLHLKL